MLKILITLFVGVSLSACFEVVKDPNQGYKDVDLQGSKVAVEDHSTNTPIDERLQNHIGKTQANQVETQAIATNVDVNPDVDNTIDISQINVATNNNSGFIQQQEPQIHPARNPNKFNKSAADSIQNNASQNNENQAISPGVGLKQQIINEFKNTGVSMILHFAYNNFEIDESATQDIVKHANFLQNNPSIHLRLEGHADERGSREYNLALGENRALNIKEILSLYDLASRVDAVSFGEEQPLDKAYNDRAWKQNRRVEFIYQ